MEHSSVEQIFRFEITQDNEDLYCIGKGSFMEIVFDSELKPIKTNHVPSHWINSLQDRFQDHIYMGTIVGGIKTLELQIFELLEEEGCTEIEFGRTNTWFGEYTFDFWYKDHFLKITTFREWKDFTDLKRGLYVTNENQLPLIKSWLNKFEVRENGRYPFKIQHRWTSPANKDLYN